MLIIVIFSTQQHVTNVSANAEALLQGCYIYFGVGYMYTQKPVFCYLIKKITPKKGRK